MTMIESLCRGAAEAAPEAARLSGEEKNAVLTRAAGLLISRSGEILSANVGDVTEGRANAMPPAMVDRLTLTKERIAQIAEGLRTVAALPDPVGVTQKDWTLENGLHIRRVSVPLGVVGVIYESRPNVTADAFAICFKSGNACVLKGGSDAIRSNRAIIRILQDALLAEGKDPRICSFVDSTDRADTTAFMQQRDTVNVLIPRGSARLIRAVVENSKIPVIETGAGNCHIYIDKDADFDKAIPIIINAKTQRIGVCNAAESLVVHSAVKDRFLPLLAAAMKEHHVLLRADEASFPLLPGAEHADETDFGKEYLDYILSVKTVDSLDEAIAHINHYHTAHSDCIITENAAAAEKFQKEIDSACVYVNASTRFTDGYEFGFGAEIGISTQKLHARGPMGLEALTSYKYLINGNGQTRK